MIENTYKIKSPKLRVKELYEADIFKVFNDSSVKLALKKANEDWLHWDQLQYKSWIPENYFPDRELFWTLVKNDRIFRSQLTPIQDVNNCFFRANIHRYNEFLHLIDKEMAGNFMGISDFSEGNKKQFIKRNLIEESIASSQLEGANTSRVVAKQMLLEGRKPRNHSEQMIVNNHMAMLRIEQELYKEKLSWELICELHSIITDQTIASEKQGKLRETLDEKGNRLVVKPWDNHTIAYVTPDREFVEAELPKLLDFANNKSLNDQDFIHPLIKAIMLHFWIGLLHPFEDGNGRLARILFYWYMLRNEYWAFAYLSLSEKIKKSPRQYAMAYVYSEQDGQDLTYFIDYNINKLKLARADFQKYVKTKMDENKLVVSLSRHDHNFNDRQIKLLQYLNQKMESRTTLEAHQHLYSVTKGTAISDLKILLEKGFLIKQKVGRNAYYYPTEKIAELFKFR